MTISFTPTTYVRPDFYLSQDFLRRQNSEINFPRYCAIVAKTSPNKLFRNSRIVRSFADSEPVTFSNITFQAALPYNARPDKTKARLSSASGEAVDPANWDFVETSTGVYGAILINSTVFDPLLSYNFSFQTVSETFLDAIPVIDLRQLTAVGDNQNQTQYVEGVDYFIPTTSSLAVNGSLSNPNPLVTSPVAGGSNTGTGTVALASSATTYTHAYNRDYTLTVTAAAGVSPNRTATLRLDVTPLSSGLATRPGRSAAMSNSITISLNEASPASLSTVATEFGITLNFTFGASNFVVADTYTYSARGAGLLELHDAMVNTNQFADLSSIAPGTNTGTGVVTKAPQCEYTGTVNRFVELEVISASGTSPNRIASIRWRTAGALPFTTGLLALAENSASTFNNVLLESGIRLNFAFGGSNFVAGDTFSFTALCPRQIYGGKENREYAISITAASAGSLTLSYSGNTRSAGFNTVTMSDGVATTLNNSVRFFARNLTQNRNAIGDAWQLTATVDGVIDWSLNKRLTETISATNIIQDVTGVVTGTVGAYFVRVRQLPITNGVLFVRNAVSTADITFNVIADSNVVWFAANPAVNMEIRYLTAGAQPAAGSAYYLTGYVKRPASDFERGYLFTDPNSAADFVAPMSLDNDAAIGNQIAWRQAKTLLPGVIFFLVRDEDEDGIYTNSDYRTAIELSEQNKELMNIVVLNRYEVAVDARDSDVAMNNPFIARQRVLFVGFPVQTPIGSESLAGSRVFETRSKLQVFEESVARGTIAVIANAEAETQIKLADGTQATVTLDGSFLALAAAARTAAFTDPAQTILNLSVNGFTSVEQLDETQLTTVQAAGMIGLNVQGVNGQSPSVQYDESITTDTTEPSTSELSGTMQRQYVIARLKTSARKKLLAKVLDGREAIASAVVTYVLEELAAMVTEGKIAPFTDDTGAPRQPLPDVDVVALALDNLTDAAFACHWNQRYPLKRVSGAFATDTNELPSLVTG